VSVLVTAFGPWDGGSNASAALLAELEARREDLEALAGAPVVLELLPVDTVVAPELLGRLLRTHRPSHALLTGQAAGRNRVALERLAVNLRDFSIPDSSGATIRSLPVVEDGPAAYRATWPDLEGAAAAIEAAGIPAGVSSHAGTHLCNQLLYTALHTAALGDEGPAAAFMHLPLTPAQVIAREPAAERHPNRPHLDPALAARAVEILLGRLGASGGLA
jgi:pyroglutamyl-peptidase